MRALALLLSLIAQAPRGAATFSSRSDLVVLHVSVVDGRAGFVGGLRRDAFTVHQDGRERPVAFFEHEDTPVSVGLVIDNSQSMGPRRGAVIAAGLAFAESSHPDDEMFTLNFNERVWPGLPRDRPFTTDREELRAALSSAGARGQTAMFDAIDAALRHLDTGSRSRKVLVLISDGGDNASHARFEDVLDGALRRDVVIYTIGLAARNDREAKPRLLRRLAAVTGGEAFFPEDNDDIGPALQRVARDIRSSYTLGFVPEGPRDDRARHRIRVDVRTADRRALSVRARSLYVTPGDPR